MTRSEDTCDCKTAAGGPEKNNFSSNISTVDSMANEALEVEWNVIDFNKI